MTNERNDQERRDQEAAEDERERQATRDMRLEHWRQKEERAAAEGRELDWWETRY